MKNKHPFIAVIDFDMTIAKINYPNIIEPIEETVAFIKELQKRDNWVWVLWTARQGEELDIALKWLEKNQLYPDYVNENVPYRIIKFGSDTRKVVGHINIDDRNYGGLKVPPIEFLDEVMEID